MKTNKQNKPRRFKVGSYWAIPNGNKIKVIGYEEGGSEYEVAAFDKNDVNLIRGIMGVDVEAEKAKLAARSAALTILRDQLSATRDSVNSEIREIGSTKVGKAYLSSLGDYASATETEVIVGCTTISRRQFERIAKLLS